MKKISSFDKYYILDFEEREKFLKDKSFLEKNIPLLSAEGVYGVISEMKLHNVDNEIITFFEDKCNECIDNLFSDTNKLLPIPYEELKNLIAVRFFKDVPLNLNVNLNVLNNLSNDDKSIKTNNLIPYLDNWQVILEDFNQISSFDEIINFYNKLLDVCKEKNNANFFRDTFAESMKEAYICVGKSMQNSLKLPTKEDKTFAIFTHTTKYIEGTNKKKIVEQWLDPRDVTSRNDKISLSYVTDKNPFPFSHNESNDVVLGFLNIRPENIESISHRNTYSMHEEFQRFAPTLYSADTFAKISGGTGITSNSEFHRHNEIIYNKPINTEDKNKVLMPDCVISRSEQITESEQIYADAFNIPIVKINPLEYTCSIDKDFHKNYLHEAYGSYYTARYQSPNISTK